MRASPSVSADSTPHVRGFPRWAWWTVFLATFMFAVPATSPWWSTVLRSEIPGSAEEDVEGPTASSNSGAAQEPPVVPGSTLKVILHTPLPGMPGLSRAEREIPYVRGVVSQIKAVVSELAVGYPDVPALLPEGTQVLDVAYDPSGTAYLDFSPELEQGRGVGAEEERVLVQGIVTTVTDNFTAVRRVVILVDGKAPKAGHLDLTRALRRDDPSFIAEEEREEPFDSEGATDAPGPQASVLPARPAATLEVR